MSMTVVIASGAAVLVALLVADLTLYRLVFRALFGLVDRLPPHRPGGRYRSQSSPERYAPVRKPRNVR
jgi:hypothetical protein